MSVRAIDLRIGFEGHAAGIDLHHKLVIRTVGLEEHVQLGEAGPVLLRRMGTLEAVILRIAHEIIVDVTGLGAIVLGAVHQREIRFRAVARRIDGL